jgi:hypothetical protein
MLNRWGLRSEADFAGSFNPFALAKHRAPGVIEALASDFSGYCQPEALMTVKTMAGHVVPARKDRQVLWTHHRGADWADDNFAPLIENMAWKIANFRAACRRPNTVFVMSDAPDPDKDPPYQSNLQEALARHTGRQDNHIILTNQSTSPHGNGLHRIDGTTFFLRCPQPVKGYAWNVDENYDSPEGLAFERDYIGLICQALRQWGLIERQDARASTT